MIPLSNITAARMVKNIGVMGRWQCQRRTKVCGHRNTQFGYSQGCLGDRTLLEKCLLCVTGNWNDMLWCIFPKQSFLGVVWPWCALPSIFCAPEMASQPCVAVTVWRRWELRMEYLRRLAKSSTCQLQDDGEEQRSQKEEKEREERSGIWYPGCRGYCVWFRYCRLTECDLLWRPMMRFSIQKWLSTFPQKLGFGVTTVHEARRREFALHHGYTNYIFLESWRTGLWNEPQKHLPGPTNNELIFIEFSMLPSAVVPSQNFKQSWVSERTFCSKPIEVHSKATQSRFHMQDVLPDYETPSSLQAVPRLYWTMLYGGHGDSSRETFGHFVWILSYAAASLLYEETLCHVSFEYLYKWPSYAHWGEQMSRMLSATLRGQHSDQLSLEIFARLKTSYSSVCEFVYAINFRTANTVSHTTVTCAWFLCAPKFRTLSLTVRNKKINSRTKISALAALGLVCSLC